MAYGIGYLQEKLFGPQVDEDTTPAVDSADKGLFEKRREAGRIKRMPKPGTTGPFDDDEASTQQRLARESRAVTDNAPASAPQAGKAPANAPASAPQAGKAPAKAPASAPTTPKTDTWAGVRADLLANAKADAAAKALAEKKRKEAEAFSASLKGATKRSSTGYDSYKSLMGE